MMELLAPAGNMESVVSAVNMGANAVYIGGKHFSARRSADNFDREEISEVVRYCHLRGVDVHVAANILVKPDEVEEFIDYMGFLNAVGVDAVIIQDIGMAKLTKSIYPDLPLHASTQMTAASLSAVRYLERAGFSRVVLSRELSERQITNIVKNSNIETEVFVHGAICMCYSGQCLMSSIIGARSGNRGMCAQPCRLPYKLIKDNRIIKEGYLLSPKDMSLVKHIDKLEKLGVTSLKIEGRLKKPEYVAAVTGIYRKYIDSGEPVSDKDMDILKNAFSRSGFTDGYFTGKIGKGMMNYDVPGNTAVNSVPEEILKRSGEDGRKIPVKIECKMCKGEKLHIKFSAGELSVSAESESLVAAAIKKPVEKERLEEQLSKLGGSVFYSESIKITMENDANISIKEINATRRKVAELLEEELLKRPERRVTSYKEEPVVSRKSEPVMTVQVETKEQLKAAEDEGIKFIYIPKGLMDFAKKENTEYIVILPEICDDDKMYEIPERFGVLISNVGQEVLYKDYKKYGNLRLNIFNGHSVRVFKDYKSVTVSQELNLKEIKKIKNTVPLEAVVYGRIPLMIMKNCPVRAITGSCGKGSEYILRDRKNQEFRLSCDGECHSIINNSKDIYMADRLSEVIDSGIERLRLIFSSETKEEAIRVIKEYKTAIKGGTVEKRPENSFTRGHFLRGVL